MINKKSNDFYVFNTGNTAGQHTLELMIEDKPINVVIDSGASCNLTLFRPGFFFCFPGPGEGLRRPYPCNSTTAYCMTPQFTQNDVVIISII